MAALFAEQLDQEIRCSVDHLWLPRKPEIAVDHTQHLYDSRHPIEGSDLSPQCCQEVQHREPSRLLGIGHGHTALDLSEIAVFAVTVGPVVGQENKVAHADGA